jgi:hypothetical protein
MSATINGSGAATLNQQLISFTPFVGSEFGGRYEGPTDAVKAIVDILSLQGVAFNYECDASPIARVTFRANYNYVEQSPPNFDYVDTWDLVRNTVQKELLESDHPMVEYLSAVNYQKLKYLIEHPELIQADDSSSAYFTVDGSEDEANYLYRLWTQGMKTVEVKQPIMRVTRTTNSLYDAPFSMDMVDKVLATGTMISDSLTPANFAIPMFQLVTAITKGRDYVKRPNTGVTIGTDYTISYYGWLKDMVSRSKSGSQRIQYVTDYKFGLWDYGIYGSPI